MKKFLSYSYLAGITIYFFFLVAIQFRLQKKDFSFVPAGSTNNFIISLSAL
jgi:hypothetical protein